MENSQISRFSFIRRFDTTRCARDTLGAFENTSCRLGRDRARMPLVLLLRPNTASKVMFSYEASRMRPPDFRAPYIFIIRSCVQTFFADSCGSRARYPPRVILASRVCQAAQYEIRALRNYEYYTDLARVVCFPYSSGRACDFTRDSQLVANTLDRERSVNVICKSNRVLRVLLQSGDRFLQQILL